MYVIHRDVYTLIDMWNEIWIVYFFLSIINMHLNPEANEITILSPKEAEILREKIKTECELNRTTDEESQIYSQTEYCLTEFDSVSCWPPTKGGTIARISCPSHVPGVKVTGIVYRPCNLTIITQDSNGQKMIVWKFDRSNYSDCVHKEDIMAIHLPIIQTSVFYGYSISMILLLIATGILLRFRRLRCTRNNLHLNLFSAILLRCVLHFIKHAADGQGVICKVFTTLHVFTIEATYSWVLMEALYLHNSVLVHVLHESRASFILYASIGWSLPILVIIAWVLLRIFVTTGDQCWDLDIGAGSPSRILLIVYPTIIMVFNLAFFINLLRVIFNKTQSQPMSDAKRLRTLLKSTSVLVLVFGLYHLFLIPLNLMHLNTESNGPGLLEIIKLYYEQIMEAFQGSFVAILLCFINKEVIAEFRRVYRRKMYLHSNTENRRQSFWLNNQDVVYESNEREVNDKPIVKISTCSSLTPKHKTFSNRLNKIMRRRSRNTFQRPSGIRRPSPLCRNHVIITK
ncbi:hypothetical protein MN116_002799 [Schistosoma mekongi]|uniref:Parathyroid hormone/parathyroid hormone-related peptide receptor n=1 Tax=Schistosoma mekongi TaxID=38744 RepID=A0AAE1ZGZ3_SCHME|nr:hypothetical protein MN116_002799 [Schistosoma mekongi]